VTMPTSPHWRRPASHHDAAVATFEISTVAAKFVGESADTWAVTWAGSRRRHVELGAQLFELSILSHASLALIRPFQFGAQLLILGDHVAVVDGAGEHVADRTRNLIDGPGEGRGDDICRVRSPRSRRH